MLFSPKNLITLMFYLTVLPNLYHVKGDCTVSYKGDRFGLMFKHQQTRIIPPKYVVILLKIIMYYLFIGDN